MYAAACFNNTFASNVYAKQLKTSEHIYDASSENKSNKVDTEPSETDTRTHQFVSFKFWKHLRCLCANVNGDCVCSSLARFVVVAVAVVVLILFELE